jgi:hypothetical protein
VRFVFFTSISLVRAYRRTVLKSTATAPEEGGRHWGDKPAARGTRFGGGNRVALISSEEAMPTVRGTLAVAHINGIGPVKYLDAIAGAGMILRDSRRQASG